MTGQIFYAILILETKPAKLNQTNQTRVLFIFIYYFTCDLFKKKSNKEKKTMKTQNPPKKLNLIKRTIAHLSDEQMTNALGGEKTYTFRVCTNKAATGDCEVTYFCIVK